MNVEDKYLLTEATNTEVIDMFIGDTFPKDKKPTWGTPNLKISKEKNGWSLMNYTTPIVFRSDSGKILFNTDKYSVTTSKIQNYIKMNIGDHTKVDEDGIRKAIK
jgi:hypothetical protein